MPKSPFSIEELPSLVSKHPGEDLAKRYEAAIDDYRKARRETLHLYPGVFDTLREIRSAGCLIVGYTESMAYYSNYRMRRLKLDGLLDYLYSPADHDLPAGLTRQQIRKYPAEQYQLHKTIHRHTPKGVLKPNPSVLVDILRDIHANAGHAIYVGDSPVKDISMAQDAGVIDVYAGYGHAQDREGYELLRRVTHWTDDAVEKEKQVKVEQIAPTYTLTRFDELLTLFDFERFTPDPIRAGNDEEKKAVIEVWKKTVEVQQHFNDLELRIRSFALTGLVALIGAAGFVAKERFAFNALGVTIPLAGLILLGGLPMVLAFWFMDRLWYHRLLYGAVAQGVFIEERARLILPELGLTGAIGRASAIQIGRWRYRSPRKIDTFYAILAAALVVAAALTPYISAPPSPPAAAITPAPAAQTPAAKQPAAPSVPSTAPPSPPAPVLRQAPPARTP